MDFTLCVIIFPLFLMIPVLNLIWEMIFHRKTFVLFEWVKQLIKYIALYVMAIAIMWLDIQFLMKNKWAYLIVALAAYLLIDRIVEKIMPKIRKK